MRVESCIVVGRATLPTRFFAAPPMRMNAPTAAGGQGRDSSRPWRIRHYCRLLYGHGAFVATCYAYLFIQ